jgi:UDP-N-acetylglucosamine acyltransferase
MPDIHPTAIVEDGAKIGEGARIGAYSIIGADAVIGEGALLHAHVVISGRTNVGARTEIYPYAMVGGAPQDTSYRNEPTGVAIGSDCVIREHSTIHRGTARGRGMTTVGDHCFLMVGSHVAHDCVLGDHVLFVNNATIGGHVEVGDHAILGGLSAVKQRVRIGAHAFVGGHSGIGGDLIPFGTATGRGARLVGLNIIGLKRRNFDRPTIHAIRGAYEEIFYGDVGTPLTRADSALEKYPEVEAVRLIVDFIKKSGVARLCIPQGENDES